jgi:antitoxin ParD1/3/4
MGMNITLPPDLEQRVRERIARGDYDNSDALVQEAVRRLIEEDEGDLASLREKLRQADAEIDRGEGLEFDQDTTKELARDIHERGMRRLADLQKSNPRG